MSQFRPTKSHSKIDFCLTTPFRRRVSCSICFGREFLQPNMNSKEIQKASILLLLSQTFVSSGGRSIEGLTRIQTDDTLTHHQGLMLLRGQASEEHEVSHSNRMHNIEGSNALSSLRRVEEDSEDDNLNHRGSTRSFRQREDSDMPPATNKAENITTTESNENVSDTDSQTLEENTQVAASRHVDLADEHDEVGDSIYEPQQQSDNVFESRQHNQGR